MASLKPVPTPQAEGDRVVALLERIAAALERIEERLPAPRRPTSASTGCSRAAYVVMRESDWAVAWLLDAAEDVVPGAAELRSAVVDVRPDGIPQRLGAFLGERCIGTQTGTSLNGYRGARGRRNGVSVTGLELVLALREELHRVKWRAE